jgi:hypothetical protein
MTDAFDPFSLNDAVLDHHAATAAPAAAAGNNIATNSSSQRYPDMSSFPPYSAEASDPPPFLSPSVSLSSSSNNCADWAATPSVVVLPSPASALSSASPRGEKEGADDEEWALFDPFGLTARSGSSSTVLRKGSISPPPQVSRINRATPPPPSSSSSSSGGAGAAAVSSHVGGAGGFGGSRSVPVVASPFASTSFVQPTPSSANVMPSSSFSSMSFGTSPFRDVAATTAAAAAGTTTSGITLPPKMVVKISIHEEVSSVAQAGVAACEGASDVTVEGTVLAQVQCSDAKKNAPFVVASAPDSSRQRGIHSDFTFSFLPDNRLSHALASSAGPASNSADGAVAAMVVKVPKEEIGYVAVGNYLVTEQVPHMPILLERKVTIQGTMVRIAVQVRSKLTNAGSMEDFTIAVAFPEHVDGRSVRVLRGGGAWDELKRIVKWKVDSLQTGESCMVTAQAQLWKPADAETEIHFPVLLRCTATADQVSTAAFEVRTADGHPASLTASIATSSRILHRLG